MFDNVTIEFQLDYNPLDELNDVKKEYTREGNSKDIIEIKGIRLFVITKREESGGCLYILKVTGSLNKFYHGNNLAHLSRNDLINCIKILSDTFQIDFNKAIIRRLDFGITLAMSKPVEAYLNLLELKKNYKPRRHYGKCGTLETVEFMIKRKSIIFYNKTKEVKSNNKTEIPFIPDGIMDMNLLRFEVKLLNKVSLEFKDYLDGRDLLIEDLTKREFYISIYKKWISEFNSVQKKISIKDLQLPSKITSKIFIESFAAIGISTYFEKIDYNNFVNILYNEDKISSRSEYYKIRNLPVSLLKKHKLKTSKNQLMAELKRKILIGAEFYM